MKSKTQFLTSSTTWLSNENCRTLDNRVQKQTIQKLKSDHEKLKDELALETRSAKLTNNLYINKQINHLHDIGEYYNKKILAERKKLDSLDSTLQQLSSQLLLQKKEYCDIQLNHTNTQYINKQIRVLENRLDKALIKFNEALAYNKSLRENIDNLRRERLVFDEIYRKLEKELFDKKLQLNEIIEISNNSYEIRNIYQSEMIELKNNLQSQQLIFGQQWAELAQQIEYDRNIKNYSNNSDSNNCNDNLTSTSPHSALITSHHDIESTLKNKITRNAWHIAKDKANIYLSMEKVQSYEEAFAIIQKYTGLTDIDELVSTFISSENHNFNLFNYVNELTKQYENINEKINTLHREKKQYIDNNNNRSNNTINLVGEKTNKMNELQLNITTVQSQLDTMNQHIVQSESTMNQLMNKINNIVHVVNGGDTVNEPVTESNMMSYLGVIEQRTNELLHLYVLQRDSDNDDHNNQSIQQQSINSIDTLQIHAPSSLTSNHHHTTINKQHTAVDESDDDSQHNEHHNTEDHNTAYDDDDEDINIVPLSHEQLAAQVQSQH